MIIKYRSRQVEIPPLRMSEVLPVGQQYSAGAKAAALAAYELAARRVLEYQESQHGSRLEDAYFGRGDAAFEGDGGRGIGEELP